MTWYYTASVYHCNLLLLSLGVPGQWLMFYNYFYNFFYHYPMVYFRNLSKHWTSQWSENCVFTERERQHGSHPQPSHNGRRPRWRYRVYSWYGFSFSHNSADICWRTWPFFWHIFTLVQVWHLSGDATGIENKCCGQRRCVTNHTRFQKLCLDPDVLQLAIRNRGDIRNDREDNSTRSFRKASYRQYVHDRYGYLGKGNRKVCPSCVVKIIRQHYPSQTGVYMGFRHEWRALFMIMKETSLGQKIKQFFIIVLQIQKQRHVTYCHSQSKQLKNIELMNMCTCYAYVC